jgi:hypothetical protein
MTLFGNSNPFSHEKKLFLKDLTELFQFPPNEWIKVRLLGPATSFADTWIKIKTKSGKIVPLQKLTLDHNPETDQYDKNICPYRAEGLPFRKTYLANAIIRSIQENEPRKKIPLQEAEQKRRKVLPWDEYRAHLKTLGSKSWTPIRVLRIPQGLAGKLKSLVDLNKHQGKKYELTDPDYGIDLSIMFDAKAKGFGDYQIQKEECTKLSNDEKNYLHYRLDIMKPESLKDAREQWNRLKEQVVEEEEIKDEIKSQHQYLAGKPKSILRKKGLKHHV